MEKILVTVDLGHFKAYRVSRQPRESAKVELIDSYDAVDSHGKMGDKVTDEAGRFGMSGGKNGAAKGYGEPHNIGLETEKRIIKQLAKDINSLITGREIDGWYLAAAKSINKQLLESLDEAVKARLEKNVASNLTNIDKSELLGYF